MFDVLMPKSPPFFDMLLEQNALVNKLMEFLVKTLENTPNNDEMHHHFGAQLEEEGDKLYAKLIRELSKSFITPIDREDLLRIGQNQEELIDYMQGLNVRLQIFGFKRSRFPALQLVRNMLSMIELTRVMLEHLSKKRDSHKTHAFRSLRDESDSILAVGLAELMDDKEEITHSQFLTILKWNQVYERLSMILEHVAQLGETIEEAVMKNV